MSCIISIHQRNRGIHVEACNYAEPELVGMYLRINIGKDEIILHCNSADDAERLGKDIVNTVQQLKVRMYAQEEEPCPPI